MSSVECNEILVVDDSALIRQLLPQILSADPELEVVGVAADPYIAREKILRLNPDVLTLAVEMPRMDGYEFLQHVRADARLRHVRVVMITSRAGQKHRKKAREAGANDYLTKPYQEPELVEKVGEMLDMELVPRRQD